MWDKHENNRQQSKKYKREWQWRNDKEQWKKKNRVEEEQKMKKNNVKRVS